MSGESAVPATLRQLVRLRYLGNLQSLRGMEVVSAYLIGARTDVRTLRRALAIVTRRHDALRMAFRAAPDHEYESVVSANPAEIPVIEERSEVINDGSLELLMPELSRPWDLRVAPLMRCGVVHGVRSESLIALAADHLIVDTWSIELVMNEILTAYDALARDAPLPDWMTQPGESFQEWARHEYRSLRADTRRRSAEVGYWLKTLGRDGLFPRLPFVGEFADGPASNAAMTCRFSSEVRSGIERYCRRKRTSYPMLIMAALATAIASETDTSWHCFHTMSAGRNSQSSLALVGWLAELIPVAVNVPAGLDMEQAVYAIRLASGDAIDHAVPFQLLVEELHPHLARAGLVNLPPRVWVNLDSLHPQWPATEFSFPVAGISDELDVSARWDGLLLRGGGWSHGFGLSLAANARTNSHIIESMGSQLESQIRKWAAEQ